MANNLDILDAVGATKTVKSTDNATVHTPHHNIDSIVSGAIASGAVASGAIASGAVASGAFASGALASGAIASGAIAAGAIAAGATSIADNEDAASASGDRGVKMLAVQLATPADSAGTDGDYSFLQMSGGRLWCSSTITGTVTVGSHAVTNAGTFVVQVDGAALTALQLIDNSIFADDAAFTLTSSSVNMAGAIRDDSLSALSAAEGDAVPLRVNSTGALHVTGGGGGTQYAVDDALGSTPTGTVSLAIRDDALSALTPVEGDAIGLRVDSTGALWCNVSNTVTVASHAVTNAGTFAVQVDGAALTALQLIDDSVVTLGTTTYTEAASKGLTIGAVRRDADTTLVDTTNEFGPLQMDANGRLKVEAFSGETLPVSLTSTTVTGTVAVTQSGTWDEVGINDSGNSITVDNGGTFAVQAACTNAGTFAVQVDGSALTSLQLIDDTVYTDDAAFTPATSKVLGVGYQADETATDSVDEGDIGAARMTLDRKQIVTVQPHTAGGLSLFRSLDLDESEEEVKATAGCLYKLRITNFSTSIRYVKLYNATAASTTVGTTTPIDTIPVPGATSATQPTVITESYGGIGLTFDTALSAAATTALADADTGAPGANEIVLSAYYK